MAVSAPTPSVLVLAAALADPAASVALSELVAAVVVPASALAALVVSPESVLSVAFSSVSPSL
ncbi:hypothetical protein MOF87_005146, partial [Salmonella enterica]|nr:hypothetical protein [Salmonella enterica]